MNRKIIESCPSCDKGLVVTRLSCTSCDTEITGRFTPNLFDRLSPENVAFVVTFVRLRGNVKEMERELAVPYASVRSRLDSVLQELGLAAAVGRTDERLKPGPDDASQRREILDQLERGDIDPTEAARRLSGDSVENGDESDE